jgi:hypothetical protein
MLTILGSPAARAVCTSSLTPYEVSLETPMWRTCGRGGWVVVVVAVVAVVVAAAVVVTAAVAAGGAAPRSAA